MTYANCFISIAQVLLPRKATGNYSVRYCLDEIRNCTGNNETDHGSIGKAG